MHFTPSLSPRNLPPRRNILPVSNNVEARGVADVKNVAETENGGATRGAMPGLDGGGVADKMAIFGGC